MNLDAGVNRLRNFERHYGPLFTRVSAVPQSAFVNVDYPCLPKDSHFAHKALTSTVVKTMEIALANKSCTYAVIFEDDTSPPPNFHNNIPNLIQRHKPLDVLYMDARNPKGDNYIPGCCTMATIYSRKALWYLSKSMNWRSSTLMKFYSKLQLRNVNHAHCLSDWMQANFLGMTTLRVASDPIVYGHGAFKSQLT